MKDLIYLAKKLNDKPTYYKTHITFHEVEAHYIVHCLYKWGISFTTLALSCAELCILNRVCPDIKDIQGSSNKTISLGISTERKNILRIKNFCKEEGLKFQNGFIRSAIRTHILEPESMLSIKDKFVFTEVNYPKHFRSDFNPNSNSHRPDNL